MWSFPLLVLLCAVPSACASAPKPARLEFPSDAELAQLVRQLATMPGRITPAGSAYAFEADTTLVQRITAANARAVPLLVDCLGDTTASEVGLYVGNQDHVVRVAAVCFQVLLGTEFVQSRIDDNAWPDDFEPFVSYDAGPETWLDARDRWRAFLARERAAQGELRSSYN